MSNIWSDTDYDWEVKALPAGVRVWSQAYAGVRVNKEGRFMRLGTQNGVNYYSETNGDACEDSEDTSLPLITDAAWEARSFVKAADDARGVANLKVTGVNGEQDWWTITNYANAENEDARIFFSAAREVLKNRMEYVLNANFGSLDEAFPEGWYNASEQDVDISGYTVPKVQLSMIGQQYYPLPSTTQWPGTGQAAFEAATTEWNNETVFEALREFAYRLLDDLEVDSLVTRYRQGLEADYEARCQRNAAMIYFAGSAATSPALLNTMRMSTEIERMVAAYRADILRSILPDSTSIAGVFHAFVTDAQRKDNFNLQRAEQILQGRQSAIDKALMALVTDAGNETSMLNQVTIGKINLAIAALDAILRISIASESARVDILRLLTALDQSLAELELKQFTVAQAARQEMQVNRMKAAMWKIEIAESLMNAATIPLGIPMSAPEPSKFETRLSAGISTGVNIATSLAAFGNPVLSVGAGLIGGLATGLLPSFSD